MPFLLNLSWKEDFLLFILELYGSMVFSSVWNCISFHTGYMLLVILYTCPSKFKIGKSGQDRHFDSKTPIFNLIDSRVEFGLKCKCERSIHFFVKQMIEVAWKYYEKKKVAWKYHYASQIKNIFFPFKKEENHGIHGGPLWRWAGCHGGTRPCPRLSVWCAVGMARCLHDIQRMTVDNLHSHVGDTSMAVGMVGCLHGCGGRPPWRPCFSFLFFFPLFFIWESYW